MVPFTPLHLAHLEQLLPVHVRQGGRELDVALLVVEGDPHLVVGRVDPVEPVDEVLVAAAVDEDHWYGVVVDLGGLGEDDGHRIGPAVEGDDPAEGDRRNSCR